MKYSIIFEKIADDSLPSDYFYAHIPALDLTTHGYGIEGAKAAALDLMKLWIEEKIANNDPLPIETEAYFSQIEIKDAIFGA